MGCCSRGVVTKGRCDDGGYSCPVGYVLRPLAQCVLHGEAGPKPGDGGSDAKNCLPKGMVCCNGDVIGTPWCGDADSSPYGCNPGYVVKPIEQCITPPP